MKDAICSAIRAHIETPAHIAAIASAARYDLLHGPCYVARETTPDAFTPDSFATFPDDVEDGTPVEFYASEPANALREYIGELPSALWIDSDSDCVMEREPDSWEPCPECENVDPQADDCELCGGAGNLEIDLSSIYALDSGDIVRALFGDVIAREFS